MRKRAIAALAAVAATAAALPLMLFEPAAPAVAHADPQLVG